MKKQSIAIFFGSIVAITNFASAQNILSANSIATEPLRIVLSQNTVSNSVTTGNSLQQTSSIISDGERAESTCVDLVSESIRFGSSDATTNGEVTVLQDFLIFSGLMDGSPTGYFGFKTHRAVLSYQRNKNINQVGRVGPLTKSLIKADTCNANFSSVSNLGTSNTLSVIVGNNAWGCGDPNRNDYTTYSASNRSDGSVTVDPQYCTSKGGKIWTECPGGRQNLREVSSLVSGMNMRCSSTSFITGPSSNSSAQQTNQSSYYMSGEILTNGSFLSSVNLTIRGNLSSPLGSGLRVCVKPSTSTSGCDTDSSFVRLQDSSLAYNGWVYNSTTDTFSLNKNILQEKIPNIEYISVFKTLDGRRYTTRWKSGTVNSVITPESGNAFIAGPSASSQASNSFSSSFVVGPSSSTSQEIRYTWLVYAGSMLGFMTPTNLGFEEPNITCSQTYKGQKYFISKSSLGDDVIAMCIASNDTVPRMKFIADEDTLNYSYLTPKTVKINTALFCGDPNRSDYTTFSPVSGRVIFSNDILQSCLLKGGKVWHVCGNVRQEPKNVTALSTNEDFNVFSCSQTDSALTIPGYVTGFYFDSVNRKVVWACGSPNSGAPAGSTGWVEQGESGCYHKIAE